MADPAPSLNKAHAAGFTLVISGAVTKIVNRYLALRFPNFWDADVGDSVGIIIDGLVTWTAVYLTPAGER